MLSYLIEKGKRAINFLFQISHKKLYYLFLRLVINKRDFCIISNNCYGGDFYQGLKLPYNTPTIGLFFVAEDYIEFLSDLKFYLKNAELEFVDKSRHFEESKDYPIGLLAEKV